jgi:methanogenic corrinoid protein MtbC1
MYTIKRAAELVGVPEATLRGWERRYGVGAGTRTPAGYRLYDEGALAALVAMKRLVDEGWSVRAAADEARSRGLADAAEQATPSPSGAPPGVGGVADLVPYAQSYDDAGLSRLLDHRFAGASFETVVDDWLLPALRALGEAWEAGEVSVAGEHFVSHGVVRRLAAAYDAAGAGRNGARTVLGLPPGSHHDLGLLSFATAARRTGLATRYLGADVPTESWIRAVAPEAVRCAVLAAPDEDAATALQSVVAAVRDARPDLVIAVGGAHQDLAPEGCQRLGHHIGTAAVTLARSLA